MPDPAPAPAPASTPLSGAQLVASLRSKVCPACGRAKAAMNTLCVACYGRLSPTQRVDLYDDLGDGYAEAVAAALARLGVTAPRLPPPLLPAPAPRSASG